MSRVESIQEKLEARAMKQLEKDVNDAVNQVVTLVHQANTGYNVLKDKPEQSGIETWSAINLIKKQLIAGMKEKRIQQEVDLFLKQVDNVQTELDELHSRINDQENHHHV